MAREIITRLRDDLDGSEASATIEFSWSGVGYSIDLSKKNAREFEKLISPYVAAADKVGVKTRSATRGGRARPAAVKVDQSTVREWAAQNGHNVSTRGRIPGAVLEAFNAAKKAITDTVETVEKKVPAKKAPAKKVAAKKAPAKRAPRKATAPEPLAEAAPAEVTAETSAD